jgi:hypothetical protein
MRAPRYRQIRWNWVSSANDRLLLVIICGLIILFLSVIPLTQALQGIMPTDLHLLTDPFLQLPTVNSVRVVWFTEFAGDRHEVEYGTSPMKTAIATTTKLSHVSEDQESRVGHQTEDGQVYSQLTPRDVWRHEAEITGLTSGERVPYRVLSSNGRGVAKSDLFDLAPLPSANQPLKILLTSDHQLKPMVSANLQKMVDTIGKVDAVFLAGDLINIPDRASEWFDDNQGNAFFPNLQGRASYELTYNGVKTRYTGGKILQYAPLFPAIGNHEVMGRFATDKTLGDQFNDPIPQAIAKDAYSKVAKTVNPPNDTTVQQQWIKQQSFNTDTYEEIFSLPDTSPGGKKYYAITFGNVRLVSLYVTNIWRSPSLDASAKGRYRERDADLEHPEQWGYGQHIFEPISTGSPQYEWLRAELQSPEFQQAKYKIVMLHHPPHCLGDNIVPAFTDPVQVIDYDAKGHIQAVRYEYPLEKDYLVHDLLPLLESAGVHLVFYGHSHLWNRFISPMGMNFLETANVGNTYGAFVGSKRRPIPIGFKETYAATDDPNGLAPVVPAIAPLSDDQGKPIPYLASNEITAFSIFDTETGLISSYYFDTRQPDSAIVKFDEFPVISR